MGKADGDGIGGSTTASAAGRWKLKLSSACSTDSMIHFRMHFQFTDAGHTFEGYTDATHITKHQDST